MCPDARQFEDFGELDDAAPVGVRDARVGRQGVEGERERAAGDADGHHGASGGNDLGVERERRVTAHAVEHERGPAAAGELTDLGRGVLAGRHRVRRPELARELELGRVDVGRDHARRRERAQQLHRHVPQAADADHDRAAAGHELRKCKFDRVIRRERGIRERSGVARVEVAERHEQPRIGDQHVLRHATVTAEAAAVGAELRHVLAQRLERQAAGAAAAAPPWAVDGHRLADVQPLDARAHRLDPPGVLVAERERELIREEPGGPLHHVQVGVTGAGTADLDEHLAGPWLRDVDVAKLRRLTPLDELVGPHRRWLVSAAPGRARAG